ncbi:MAG: glycine zipper family protein [Proteobacteria bacterium]|nr:glycine zipper family protein [Pseudomonadota bacterium]MCH7957144.1 glycine zipper family protein [Pseudomonadota bacterium]MCH8214532.1 glycine zipper family protein [Pseudomonadota bacterium]
MKRIVAMSTAACLVVAGCAQFYKPAVDLKGADQATYESDLAQCRDQARQEVAEEPPVIGGAILLALVGAVLGLYATGPFDGGSGAAIGAAAGAATGAALGGLVVSSKQIKEIDGCLLSRGYTVRL